MIRLKVPRDNGLALPKSTPVTLVEISSESLPYACQCPLCGEVFQIPEALLYKVEDDDFADDDLAEFEEADGSFRMGKKKVLPMAMIFDHKIGGAADLMPFIRKMDEIFGSPQVIHQW